MRKLGSIQLGVLQALSRHGSYSPVSGWQWSSELRTIAILDSLVKRGLVIKTLWTGHRFNRNLNRDYYSYKLSEIGDQFLRSEK